MCVPLLLALPSLLLFLNAVVVGTGYLLSEIVGCWPLPKHKVVLYFTFW